MHKTRPSHDIASVTEITGKVEGKVAIVGDDSISSGNTLLEGAPGARAAERSAMSGSSPPTVSFPATLSSASRTPTMAASSSRTRFRSILSAARLG